ncbi:PspC domain-containing protein [Streptomyces marispadix]|uniref:PspC domain-containing protein n=1 Tax=Streptomyces marispadix TaxID=2922868 RepID=A0ABS9T0S2_9ACTN|nr:PspC domain-containing protein [Streptomyces marispadix]MCH6162137.1 PspC domain-containing protein [Streptomyces marispadix]
MTEDDEHAPGGGGARGGGGAEARHGAGERGDRDRADRDRAGRGGGDSGRGAGAHTGERAGPTRPAPRLVRSRRPKVVAGVCSGLGRCFGLDPVIFRVPLVVLSVVGGLGLVFYGAAWLLIPAEGERQNEARWLLSGRVEGTTLSAILVALVGCGLFLASLGSRSTPFSLLLAAAVGGAAYWSHHRREAEAAEAVGAPVDPTTAHAVADAPPEAQAPPVPGMPSWWREPLTKDGTGGPMDTGYLWGPDDGTGPADVRDLPGARARGWAGGPVPGSVRGPIRVGRRRERSFGGLVAMLAAAAAVAGAAPGWDSRPLGTSLTVGFACALAVWGLGFAVSAFAGRVGFGSLVLTVGTAVMLTGVSLIPKSIGTDWRDAAWAPASAADVAPVYELDGGNGELDLGHIRFRGDRKTVRTKARIGVGTLKVVVPSDTRVELTADLTGGELRLPTQTDHEGDHFVVESSGGFDRHERWTLPAAGPGAGPRTGPGADTGPGTGADGSGPRGDKAEKGTLELSVGMTFGQVEIVRLLPTGERTDHLPGDVVPHEEQVREHLRGHPREYVREHVGDHVREHVRDHGSLGDHWNPGGGR